MIGAVDVGDDGVGGSGDRDDRAGLSRQLSRGGKDGIDFIGGFDSTTTESDSGECCDLGGVAADGSRVIGGGTADAGGAEVDGADAHGVEDPGLAGGVRDVDGCVGGEQLMVRGGSEVDEDSAGDSGELSGVGFVVEHRRGGADGQEHVRAELLHHGVRDALDEWIACAQSRIGRTQVEVNHDDPFASMAQIRFDGCSLSLGVLRAQLLGANGSS